MRDFLRTNISVIFPGAPSGGGGPPPPLPESALAQYDFTDISTDADATDPVDSLSLAPAMSPAPSGGTITKGTGGVKGFTYANISEKGWNSDDPTYFYSTTMDLYYVMDTSDPQFISWLHSNGNFVGCVYEEQPQSATYTVTIDGYRVAGTDYASTITRSALHDILSVGAPVSFEVQGLVMPATGSWSPFGYAAAGYQYTGKLYDLIVMPGGTDATETRAYIAGKYGIAT